MVDNSIIVFIAFGMMLIGIVLAIAVALSDWIMPIFSRVRRLVHGVYAWFRKICSSRDTSDGEEIFDADDMSNDAMSVLAMLPMATMVVDADNEVVRASSTAYQLGLVVDDAIVQPRVLEAIDSVRKTGGNTSFTLITHTPAKYIAIQESGDNTDEYGDDNTAEHAGENASVVTRRNWLNITVGKVSNNVIVVLIVDTSAQRRFELTRKDFIANVSEQLIGSADTITHIAQVLQNKQIDVLSAQRIQAVAQVADRSAQHLQHMVKDLLLLMRAQHPIDKAHADVLRLEEEISAVVQALTPMAKQLNIRIAAKIDASLRVRGDSAQIRAAIEKLVENAIIYSHSRGVVAVSAALSSDNNYAVIRVVDTGVGIAQKDQTRIFERFYRADNQNEHSASGVGLGLSIAKHVALTHHGSITLWSRPAKGTTLSFALPLAICQDDDNPNGRNAPK